MSEELMLQSLAKLQVKEISDGRSIYEHLCKLLVNLVAERQDTINLKDASEVIKRQTPRQMESDHLIPCAPITDPSQCQATLELFGDREVPIDTKTGQPVRFQEPNAFQCENIVKAGQLFEAAGLGLPGKEMLTVSLAARRLGQDPNLKLQSVRFFGKFFGLYADYYVFETTPLLAEQVPAETPEERITREAHGEYPRESGTGANAFTYYVCTSLGGTFSRLPDVLPQHIRAARRLKRCLTGRLDAAVATYPPFPWPETTFLRAQIARIAASTVLAPAGWYEMQEDDDGNSFVARAEDIEPLQLPEAGAVDEWLANWVHRYPHLKAQGRCEAKPIRSVPEDAEDEEVELTEEEQEEGPEALAPVSDDVPVCGAAAWTAVLSSSSPFAKGQVMALRSNLWPGAAAVVRGTEAFNIYVGWGQKSGPYVPPPPPPVAEEYDQAQMASIDMPQKADPDVEPPAEGDDEEEEDS